MSVIFNRAGFPITQDNKLPGKIKRACDFYWDKYKSDCSGFLQAVAASLGIILWGQANAIIDQMNDAPWLPLNTDISKAISYANLGYLVVAGLKGAPNGHLAIIMPNSLRPYPKAYWGRLGGVGKKDSTINWSWKHADLEHVQYFVRRI